MTSIPQPKNSAPQLTPFAELGKPDVISVECHYAGTKLFTADIAATTTFANLSKLINKTFNLQSSEIIVCIDHHYRNLTTENFAQTLRERLGTLTLYIAESVRGKTISARSYWRFYCSGSN
jgi:hypothetical protein